MINIVLCGGSGTRVWPISRKTNPKQLCDLIGKKSLYRQTLTRNAPVCEQTIAVAGREHFAQVRRQTEQEGFADASYIIEPFGRNTAGAIALACFGLDADDIVLVTPSDHQIDMQENYSGDIIAARDMARDDCFVVFGIAPAYPETGFGYIEADDEDVIAFHEKPDIETAVAYVDSGRMFWNSGMFCFRAGLYLSELRKFAPDIYDAARAAYENATRDGAITRIAPEDMEQIRADSIDFAVIEKTDRLKMVKARFEWSDLGSFDALYKAMDKDAAGNALRGDVVSHSANNNLVMANGRLVALVEVDDLIVVDTEDALLVTRKGRSQEVRHIVRQLESGNVAMPAVGAASSHVPSWGSCDVLQDEPGCTVKRVVVGPGKALSLIPELHSREHWLVARGSAVVETVAGDTHLLSQAGAMSPDGVVKAIRNESGEDLVLIVTELSAAVPVDNDNPAEMRNGDCAWLSIAAD